MNKKFVVILLVGVAIFAWSFFRDKQTESLVIETIDEIHDYGYTLDNRDFDEYEKIYKELKKVLSDDVVDEEKYANYIAQLFVLDFYTLENKITNQDVGGVEFLSPEIKGNFILKAKDTLYKTVESNVYGDRVQELPKVLNAIVGNIDRMEFSYQDQKDFSAYVITLNVHYEKDLGYPTEVVLTIVHQDSKLYIVEVK